MGGVVVIGLAKGLFLCSERRKSSGSVNRKRMEIAIVGTGYVGLVSGVCFAEIGARVHCIDTDAGKIARLRAGEVPIYEPGITALVRRNVEAGRLTFGTALGEVLGSVDIVFIAVGTPPDEDGSADLKYVLEVARTIGAHLERYVLVVTKSTVPVGSSERVRGAIEGELRRRGVEVAFDVASNPEFLKEGDAINDFMKPDRVVVGVDSARARELMTELYKPMLLNHFRVLFMDIPSAEMTKYAANAMLATRISFMNEVAALCEAVGADVTSVRHGVGADSRIGNRFLYPGCGYGGSCFPKDVRALIHTGAEHGVEFDVLRAVERVNARQKELLFRKFSRYYERDLQGRKVGVWGLSFKPGTDDMREAPALVLIEQLLKAGCIVSVYDPVAMPRAGEILGDAVRYAASIYETAEGADAIFHVTEWKEYRMPDWGRIAKLMRRAVVFDGRNVFDGESMGGVEVVGIGR